MMHSFFYIHPPIQGIYWITVGDSSCPVTQFIFLFQNIFFFTIFYFAHRVVGFSIQMIDVRRVLDLKITPHHKTQCTHTQARGNAQLYTLIGCAYVDLTKRTSGVGKIRIFASILELRKFAA